MSGMQQIKTPVGEHFAPPIAFPWAKPQNRFVQTQNPGAQFQTLSRPALHISGRLSAYHAGWNCPFLTTGFRQSRFELSAQ
jgi:hypothetical protein